MFVQSPSKHWQWMPGSVKKQPLQRCMLHFNTHTGRTSPSPFVVCGRAANVLPSLIMNHKTVKFFFVSNTRKYHRFITPFLGEEIQPQGTELSTNCCLSESKKQDTVYILAIQFYSLLWSSPGTKHL